MQKLVFLLFLVALSGCGKKSNPHITIKNPSQFDLVAKPIEVSLPTIPNGLYPYLTTESGDTIPSQLSGETLFFVANITAQSTLTLNLLFSETNITYPPKTSIRTGKRLAKNSPVFPIMGDTLDASELLAINGPGGFQPYQTDGPSFENDKVGFRHYFDGRNAKDLFGKKVSSMSPETVGIGENGGVKDNYHIMEDWGRDILSVGNSVGIGGTNFMIGDQFSRIGCTADDTITNIEQSVFFIKEEGPVRSTLEIHHHNWKPFDHNYQIKEEATIWPGMYGFQNTIQISGLTGNEIFTPGIVNSNTEQPLKEIKANEKYVVLLTHDQQTYDKTWWLGLALILPAENYLGFGEAPKEGVFSTSYFGKLRITENNPVSYYAIGCWELSDEKFIDPEYFESYVVDLANQLSIDVAVSLKE